MADLQSKIETDDGWLSVNKDLIDMKNILTNSNNIKMHVAADLNELLKIKPEAPSLLEQLLPTNVKSSDKS